MTSFTDTGPDMPPSSEKIARDQRLRIKRLGMSCASYGVTFTIVASCAALDMLQWSIALRYLAATVAINVLFLMMFRRGYNLRFRDPSLTSAQMLVSILPALYIMYFLDSGQARAAFVVVAIVPILYGVLSLDTRRFMIVGALFVVSYSLLIGALMIWRPHVMTPSLELLQAVVLVLVIGEIAIIGGYISGLRTKVRQKNQELNEALIRIRDMANRDALTGLFNRRHLFEVLAGEMNREWRTRGSFSICILDVDHFKEVNDEHGHQAGDLVLKRIAERLSVSLRNIDCIGRYGGEEFLIVLPQTELEGAIVKAERVRKSIRELEFPEIGPHFQVSVSAGVAKYQPGEDVDETIHRADQALYAAKAAGRNCTKAEKTPVPDSGN